MRAALGIAAGLTGTEKSSSRLSEWVSQVASCGRNVTAGPSAMGLPATLPERSPVGHAASGEHAMVAENGAMASSSVLVKAPGGTERDASVRPPVPFMLVADEDRAAFTESPALPPADGAAHVGMLASGRTSTGRVPVKGAASVGRCTLTVRLVVPAASADTVKSLVGCRRSSAADDGAVATVASPMVIVAVTGTHMSGSTTRRIGLD